MKLFPLLLHLPNEETFQIELNPEDSLLKVLQELFFFEILDQNDEQGNLIAYRFLHTETHQALPLGTEMSELFPQIPKQIVLKVEQEIVLEEERLPSPSQPVQDDMLSIMIRLVPSIAEVDVDLPSYLTTEELIAELGKMEGVPQHDEQGELIEYGLVRTVDSSVLPKAQQLQALGIQPNEILELQPNPNGHVQPELSPSSQEFIESETKILFRFPDQLSLDKLCTCVFELRIHTCKNSFPEKGFSPRLTQHRSLSMSFCKFRYMKMPNIPC